MTPLLLTVINKCEGVETLLEMGTDTEKRYSGKTALMYAVEKKTTRAR